MPVNDSTFFIQNPPDVNVDVDVTVSTTTVTLKPGESIEINLFKDFWDALGTLLSGALDAAVNFIGTTFDDLLAEAKKQGLTTIFVARDFTEDNGVLGSPSPDSSVVNVINTGIASSQSIPNTSEKQANPQQPGERTKGQQIEYGVTPNKYLMSDPVDLYSGSFYIEETDFSVPDVPLALHFTRFYRSGRPYYGPFGWNWDHNHNLYIRPIDPSLDVALWNGRLEEEYYKYPESLISTDPFEPPRGRATRLVKISSTEYHLSEPGGMTYVFKKPTGITDSSRIPIETITDRYDNKLHYSYIADPETGIALVKRVVLEVGGEKHRYFEFSYGSCGLLEHVYDIWDETYDDLGTDRVILRTFDYYHDPDIEHLVLVKSPGDAEHPDSKGGFTKQYIYYDPTTNVDFRHNIIMVLDGNKDVYITNKYGEVPFSSGYNKVVEQAYGYNVYSFEYFNLQLVPPPDFYLPGTPRTEHLNYPSKQTFATTPDGDLSVYTFNYRGDLLEHRIQLSRGGIPNLAITGYTYDAIGNLERLDRPDGTALVYEYNHSSHTDPRLRNLVTKITLDGTFIGTAKVIWEGTYDLDGTKCQNLLTEEDEYGSITTYNYDSLTGKVLESIEYPDTTLPDATTQSAEVSFTFDSGRVASIVSPNSIQQNFTYGTDTSRPGEFDRLIQHTQDLDSLATDSIVTGFEYDSDGIGFISKIIDGEGRETKHTHNKLGDLLQTELWNGGPAGPTINYHYDLDHNIIGIDRPKGSFTEAGFTDTHIKDILKRNVLGHVTKSIIGNNTASPVITAIYPNYRGEPETVTDQANVQTQSVFDERGQILSRKIAKKSIKNPSVEEGWRYDLSGKLLIEIHGRGTSLYTKYKYDEYGRIYQIDVTRDSSPDTSSDIKLRKEYNYTKTSKLTGPTPPTTFPWVGTGVRVLPTTSLWIGANNLVVLEELIENPEPSDSSVGTLKARKFSEYDERGRLVQTIIYEFPIVSEPYLVTKYTYDPENNLIKVTDFRGNDTEYEYDGIGRLTKVTDASGNEESYTYFKDGQIETRTLNYIHTSGARTWTYAYDERGRLESITDPDTQVTSFEFDDRDLLISVTNAVGVVTEFEYGLLGEKTKQTLDMGGANPDIINQWAYDSARRLKTYIDPLGQETKYSYDTIGRLTKTDLPGGASFEKTFLANGRLSSVTAASGAKINYAYDDFGRINTFNGTSGTGGVVAVPTHTFTYDGLDRILTANITSGPEITRSYNSLSQLLSEENHGYELKAEYDNFNGEMVRHWVDDTRKEKLTFNEIGIVTDVVRTTAGSLGNDTTPLLMDLEAAGPFITQADLLGSVAGAPPNPPTPGSKKIRATWDREARFLLINAQYQKMPPSGAFSNNEKIDYAYDDLGRRITEKITNGADTNERQSDNSFDNRNRLTQAIVSDPDNTATIILSHGYEYTEADERDRYVESSDSTPFTSPTVDRAYTYTDGHRLTDAGSDSADTYTDGPLKEIGTQDYTIDALGRVVEIDGDYAITFDALGRPAILDDGTTVRKLCYFGDELWQEVAGSTIDRQYSHHPNFPDFLAIHKKVSGVGKTYVPMTDGRMNRLGITDSGGNVVERYRYSPFGETSSSSGVGLEPWFGSMRYIESKGLYLGRHRIYHPTHGMWLGLDPKGYIDSPNLYAYASQNPIDFVDPLGLASQKPNEEVGFMQRQSEEINFGFGNGILANSSVGLSAVSGILQSLGQVSNQTTGSGLQRVSPKQPANPSISTGRALKLPFHYSDKGYNVYYDQKGVEVGREKASIKWHNSAGDTDPNNYFIRASVNAPIDQTHSYNGNKYWRLEGSLSGAYGQISNVIENPIEQLKGLGSKYRLKINFWTNPSLSTLEVITKAVPGSLWDFKKAHPYRNKEDVLNYRNLYVINGVARMNDYAGNVVFGIIMAQGGWPVSFQTKGAGIAQLIDDLRKDRQVEYRSWEGLWDDERDTEAIIYGSSLIK